VVCGGVTHFLLATLVAGPLYTWLSLFLAIAVVVIIGANAGRTAINSNHAATPLSLWASVGTVAGAHRAGRTDGRDSPAGDRDGRTIHAGGTLGSPGRRQWPKCDQILAVGRVYFDVARRGGPVSRPEDSVVDRDIEG
jgi:hypothetical protein